jgi:hypothetical protein
MALAAVVETTFPSAQPESLGSGKYQLGPGVELLVPLSGANRGDVPRAWSTIFKPWIEQDFSVAGDESREDINYTKLELELKAEWRKKLILKLTPKFVFDWEQGAESGAVLELEGGWNWRRWRTTLTLGHGLWNTDAGDLWPQSGVVGQIQSELPSFCACAGPASGWPCSAFTSPETILTTVNTGASAIANSSRAPQLPARISPAKQNGTGKTRDSLTGVENELDRGPSACQYQSSDETDGSCPSTLDDKTRTTNETNRTS